MSSNMIRESNHTRNTDKDQEPKYPNPSNHLRTSFLNPKTLNFPTATRMMMMMTKKQDYGCSNYEKITRGASSVPKKGHFVVYVGKEHQRFVVPLSYLKSSIFRELLDEAAAAADHDEERGSFKNNILLPCDVLTFQRVLRLLALSCKKGMFSF